jgi:cytochrome c-L
MNVFQTAGLGATCLATALVLGIASAPAQSDGEAADGAPLAFTHALDDEPLDVFTPREGEEFTEAVEDFHLSGENPYDGEEEAIADGEDLFNRNCRACHGVEGAGGMGAALDDEVYKRERAATDKGIFEIIHGGSAGAMQPFANRLDQDEMLRIMAYIDTFGEAE